jgi:hypothetical protein
MKRMIEEQVNLRLRRNIRALQQGAMIAALAALSTTGMILQNVAAQEINGGATVPGSQINLVDRMRDIETTIKARVFLMPIFESRGGGLIDETGVAEAGCPYVTQDPLRIKGLIEILRNAELNAVSPTTPGWMGQIQEGIILDKSNGYSVSFFFTGTYKNAGARGYVNYPFFFGSSRTFLTAKASLPDELKTWALAIGPSIVPGDIRPVAPRLRGACDYFAAKGRK